MLQVESATMRITAAEVRATAELARLELSDDELSRLERELSAILDYMSDLAKLDTEGVEPMTHAVPMNMLLRADKLGVQLATDLALASAPRKEGSFFEVPKIIEVGE
jgi:aspartyl-tRNA(Asn)/glutamyl-tRNA(Gln) amidotransferase subunit C